jgi:hypothetical protein
MAKKKKNAKLIGKHSLTFDTIFRGKRDGKNEEYESEHIIKNAGGALDIDTSRIDTNELKSSVDYYRDNRLKREIIKILDNQTNIDIKAPRRKPSKIIFNEYFELILTELNFHGYSKTEIFIELSGYFSDNIWNIFLLLDNKYSNIIIKELKEKYGLDDIDSVEYI